jgi:hypothetical protein
MSTTPAEPPARAIAMRTLAVDAVGREIVRVFADDGIDCILLKGAALRDRLYDEGRPRDYADVDLLVPPGRVRAARTVLAHQGFRRRLDPRAASSHMPQLHAEDWLRGRDVVDLHWRVPGVETADETAWTHLRAHTEARTLGGTRVRGLDDDASALLLALHAAHHGTGVPKPLEDLARGLERLERATWRQAARLARELNATEALSAGLRTRPAGAILAAELGLPAPTTPAVRLKAGANPPAARVVLALASTPWTRKPRVLMGALLPSPEFMRARTPLARRGRSGLAAAYLVRIARRARQLPRGIAAARSARAGAE